jgi:hypothetical protein
MTTTKTNTSIFMVPTLKINKDQLLIHNFINAYIKDIEKEIEYEDCVFLVFKPKTLETFQEFVEREYERTPQLVDDYDYDKGYVILVYTLDPRWERDFLLVKQGKYSKTSKEFQNQFSKVTTTIKGGKKKEQASLQYRIFTKDDELRGYWEERINREFTHDMEVWEGWFEENETLTPNKLKQLV